MLAEPYAASCRRAGPKDRRTIDGVLVAAASALAGLEAVVARSAPETDEEIGRAVVTLLGLGLRVWRAVIVVTLALSFLIVVDALVRRRWLLVRDLLIALALVAARRATGLVQGGRDGLKSLENAVDAVADSPARLEHASARTEFGAALHRANRRSEAREQLRRALELAILCAAAPLAARAETELRATGARPRRIALRGVESLTPSERRVAELAAEGPTNREIAQALFVTPRTVELHLTNAYRKLGIGSRTELAAALSEPSHA